MRTFSVVSNRPPDNSRPPDASGGRIMNKSDKKTLQLFQCDYNRSIEENFAQVLTENEQVRLFFINENQAFTDGRNIVVDPAYSETFADRVALQHAEDYLQIGRRISSDPWYALRMITRGQNIHECLHVIYTDFPSGVWTDPRATAKARITTLRLIYNIIEDAFIEAVGCSIYDNLELYLQFERIATFFSRTPVEGTVDRAFKDEMAVAPELLTLIEYLDYMAVFLLYPMVEQKEPPAAIAAYVERTKQLFLDGSSCGDPKERYCYTQRVFDIIEPLIPENDAALDEETLLKLLPGFKTHSGDAQTITAFQSTGKTATVTRRLFTDLAGNELPKRDFRAQMDATVSAYQAEKEAALQIVLVQPVTVTWQGDQYDCAAIHKNIKIIETKPKPNLNLRRAYQNIYNKYHININSFNGRFAQLLKARITVREERKHFGSGISSTRLADVKKRYWYRNTTDFGVPDLAVMLLIDGSGSMSGERRDSAMVSSVILHEVLKKQSITHAIVEHRAIYGEPTVRHNILIDFMATEEEKLNIITLQADEGTREGLSLYWAERYIASKTTSEEKLIIVLSDGVPAHGVRGEGDYVPPVSLKDTANAAAKIIKRGTAIIAVALDDDASPGASCYDDLQEIYPTVVACTDLKRLTGQLLGIISKNLR